MIFSGNFPLFSYSEYFSRIMLANIGLRCAVFVALQQQTQTRSVPYWGPFSQVSLDMPQLIDQEFITKPSCCWLSISSRTFKMVTINPMTICHYEFSDVGAEYWKKSVTRKMRNDSKLHSPIYCELTKLSLSISLSVCRSLAHYLLLFLSFSLFLFILLSLFICHSLSPTIIHSFPSFSLFLSLSLSLSLYIYIYIYI